MLGMAVGLGAMEGAFWLRDDGAFPHANFYTPDEQLGVRLEPGASQRLRFAGNPVTRIRTNSLGLRGADPGPPSEGEIVIVGDSQVFGLGVEEDETFAAVLAQQTGRPVLNAGVPTYGPQEYLALAAELLESRRPAVVVTTLNFVNDPFEAERPNRERHAVWDGWAVRVETAPESTLAFPGRRWLMRNSHAVYATRALLHDDALAGVGFSSEGSWTDLATLGVQHRKEQQAATQVQAQVRADRGAARVALKDELGAAEAHVEAAMYEAFEEVGWEHHDARILLRAARGDPGDIIGDRDVESTRSVAVTATMIRQGVKLRRRLQERLDQLRGERAERVRAALEKHGDVTAETRRALRTPSPPLTVPSVLTPHVEQMRALCERYGAELVVLALPMDVQVDATEWEKYPEAEPVDMTPSRVLIDDLIADAARLGVRAVDVTPALAAAQPGAFLDGDIHMTPKGHAAVAAALALTLDAPPPPAEPAPGLPEGRTWIPAPRDWLVTPERLVRGSSAADCETTQIDEWLRITCLRTDRNRPTGVRVLTGDHGEALTVVTADAATLITPLFPGEVLEADFSWTNRRQRLTVQWEEDRSVAGFTRLPGRGASLSVSDPAAALCALHAEQRRERLCEQHGEPLAPEVSEWRHSWVSGCEESCAQLAAAPSPECAETWAGDDAMLLACAEGDPLALPSCPAGSVNAGGAGRCSALCSEDVPCAEGTCHPWQGTGICW